MRARKQTLIAMLVAICGWAAVPTPVHAVTSYYWDLPDEVSGANGPSPSGTWDVGVTPNWQTNSAGAGANLVYVNASNADVYFAAGTAATGSYDVTVNGSIEVRNIYFQEGSVTLKGSGTQNLQIDGVMTINATSGAITFDSSLGSVVSYQNDTWTNNSNYLFTVNSGVNLRSGRTMTLVPGAAGILINGTLAGAGHIAVAGVNPSDTATFANANTYTGNTTLTSGTLRVSNTSGSATGTGSAATFTLNGGTLVGTGIIGTNTTVNAAVIAPGNSAGTLTFTKSLALSTDSIFDFELNGADATVGSGVNDLIAGVTNLTLDGTLNITALAGFAGATPGDAWRLINYTGTLIDNGLVLGTRPALASGYQFAIDTATAGQVNLIVIAIPEPAALAMLGVGGLMMIPRRRRA